jgi:6-phosphogluconolactonase (cycloisomerase 2 family)
VLGSQGAVILGEGGHDLFAVNAGSNSISYFKVRPDGLELQDTIASGGATPSSLTLHHHVLYVLNAGGAGNITGFVVRHGELSPLAGSTRPLGAGSAGPAQVAFTPNGKVLVVTEKSSSTIDTYVVGHHGIAGSPTVHAAVGGTPFGFDFDKHGNLLTSNATGSASSYDVAKDGSVSVISGAVPTFQGAPCWLVSSKNGRYAYTANAGSGTISGFSVDHDGALTLLDPSGISGNLGAGSHPLDEAVGEDGHFLHVLVDGTHHVGTFRIAHDGSLAFAGTVGGLPAGAIGLAAD